MCHRQYERRIRIILIAIAVVTLFTGDFVRSQDNVVSDPSTESKKADDVAAIKDGLKFPVEMGIFKVKVVDTKENPIVGAAVEARGARCVEEPGSWYSWPSANAGSTNVFTTDASGQVEFQYPKKFGTPPNYRTLSILCIASQHPEFISEDKEIGCEAGELKIVMKPGCKIEFSAVDEGGKPIEKFGVLVTDHHYTSRWVLEKGTLRSSAVPDGKWQTMLVSPADDGRTLFSGILPARYVTGQPFTIRNVILTPGLCVQGRLPDEVPRPIEDGIVVSWSQPKPTKEAIEKREAIGWQESTPIAADGTFQFNSLPRTGTLQLIALCRGWVCVDQPREGKKAIGRFKTGTLLKLSEMPVSGNILRDVELPMEEAGAVEVSVRKQDGSPLAGAGICTCPNQMLQDGGSEILGEKGYSLEIVEDQMANRPIPNFWLLERKSRYSQKTDERGIATLYDIPLRSEQSIYVGNDEFQAVDNGNRDRAISFTLDSPEIKKIEVVVEPIKK